MPTPSLDNSMKMVCAHVRNNTFRRFLFLALFAIVLQGCGGGGGETAPESGVVDTVAPFIVSTVPDNTAAGVLVDASFSVVFSEPMDTTTPVDLVFEITPAVNGQFSWSVNDTVLTFTPDQSLDYQTSYSVNIAATLKDKAGNLLIAGLETSFTSVPDPVSAAPFIISTVPANLAADVPIDATFSVTFSEPMDTSPFDLNFVINPEVGGSFAWSENDTVLTFTPDELFGYQTSYSVNIARTLKDKNDNLLSDGLSTSFMTAAIVDSVAPSVVSITPNNTATSVPVDTTISITFSESMDTSAAAFGISPTASGSFAWSINDTVLTFTPDAALAYETTYSVNVPVSLKDKAGNALSSALNSSFTTEVEPDTVAPFVVSTSPANVAMGVAIDATFSVTFSESMDTTPADLVFGVSLGYPRFSVHS